jgi:uncharacterized OsmC-like protein
MIESMSEVVGEFKITLDQIEDYKFQVNFDDENLAPLRIDEPPPLGSGDGPNPARILASAIGSCLSASLLFCLSKRRVQIRNIRAEVNVQTIRNESRRLRIGKIDVVLSPEIAPEDREKIGRCLEIFEDFCTVTQSIRDGIDVDVRVEGV